MPEVPRTARTTPRTLPSRSSSELATILAIVDQALHCHVSVVVDGTPHLAPLVHGRVGLELFLHGSPKSTLLQALAGGAEACVAFTLVDGLVLGRSAMHHSLNYRSVVAYGRGRAVTNESEKAAALHALTERILPDHWDEVRTMSRGELEATTVVALSLAESGAKIRSGPPKDVAADLDGPWWAGVVPLTLVPGAPIPSPDLRSGIEVPASIRALAHRFANGA